MKLSLNVAKVRDTFLNVHPVRGGGEVSQSVVDQVHTRVSQLKPFHRFEPTEIVGSIKEQIKFRLRDLGFASAVTRIMVKRTMHSGKVASFKINHSFTQASDAVLNVVEPHVRCGVYRQVWESSRPLLVDDPSNSVTVPKNLVEEKLRELFMVSRISS